MKKTKLWPLLLIPATLGPSLVVIVACSQEPSSSELTNEISRLESLKLVAKNQEITKDEFEKINANNINNYITNYEEIKKPGFETRPTDLNKKSNRIFFKFSVKELSTSYMKSTKTLSLDLNVAGVTPLPPDPVQPEPDIPENANGWAPITNKDPASANQYDISHADQYHFNRPYYENDQVTLKQNGSASGNKPSPGIPSNSTTYAKEDWISTPEQAQLAKQVFAVSFVEEGGVEKTGTAWILDYKLTDDGSYPLTWYFGTNAHVIDDLRVANDTLYPEKFAKWDPTTNKYRAQNTRRITFAKLLNPKAKTNYYDSNRGGWELNDVELIDRSKEDDYWNKQEGFYIENPPVKTIFQGFDFLTTSPKQFSAVNPWKDKEEYADFGVFEVTFKDQEQAKRVTNDYYNWDEDLKFKYRPIDFVNHPEQAPTKIFEVGYPSDNNVKHVATNTNALWFNQGVEDQNNGFTKSLNYSTWVGLDGRFDAHIAMSDFGYSYEWMDNTTSDPNQVRKSTPYVGYGLIYGTEGGNMRGGSSGALSVDQDGYAIGIHYASDNNSAMGGSQAFVSQGYDYKGYYGNYNMPAYDLIRGGGKYQKASYYDNLVKLYGNDPSFKTRLFPNGLKSRY